jgi:hypothetical protein
MKTTKSKVRKNAATKPRTACRHKPRKQTLSDGTEFTEDYYNQRPAKRAYKEAGEDYEEGAPPKDEASKLKYPPPSNHPLFRKIWVDFIGSIENRVDFKIAHLHTLRVLCDLYVEYEEFSKVLRTEGRTYDQINKFGKIIQLRPEVAQLERVKQSIQNYTKMLDLAPKKEKDMKSGQKGSLATGKEKSEEWG